MDRNNNGSAMGKNTNNNSNNNSNNSNNNTSNINNSNNTTHNTTNTRVNSSTNNNRTPDNTSRKIIAESPRNPSQQTPKTPTSVRVKTTPTSRGTTPTSALPSPHLVNLNRGANNNNNNDKNGSNNTPKDRQSKRDDTDSTTPAYPDSTTLLNRSTSSAKIQLSDMQPVETKVVERIKNLEISIEQHRASHEQLEQLIHSLQQELTTVKENHEAVVQVADSRTQELKSAMDELQETSLSNSGRLQELWELVRQLSEDLAGKERQLVEIQNRIEDLKQSREEILKDREETEREPLEITRMEKAKLLVEYEEIQGIEQSCVEIMEELKKSFSSEEIEKKRAKVMENEDRIAQLEGMIAESKTSFMIDERNADELILQFEKVYERRIRSHTLEFKALEHQAMELERQRDQEANAALEEYLRLNQLSVEAEESASREEFNLLAEREKLVELESLLKALKLELVQGQETVTA
ncbi:hypothetical protein K457DRAFT_119798 [Linnemannia elongata AG-77]|uniref:Uncharacterized protein n=1 Tax=Linnemannia elongata AG-77 TaxID=1314771 RepID=A0A197KGX8_9FUNG|nr:hypothetical protein K457DRAFT_119798 [Linnemannia elongata AG-77]